MLPFNRKPTSRPTNLLLQKKSGGITGFPASSTVIPGRVVGEWTIVGAGAVVIDDVAPNATVVGVPARVVGERPAGWQHEC